MASSLAAKRKLPALQNLYMAPNLKEEIDIARSYISVVEDICMSSTFTEDL
jgi:hypothetical protein